MTFKESTDYETEILKARMDEFPGAMVHFAPVALQRYNILSTVDGVVCECETNDDDDDGIPDGKWESWIEKYESVEQALRVKGECRVGISGVIVTVTVNGKEIR
jgi:hypothetical protein